MTAVAESSSVQRLRREEYGDLASLAAELHRLEESKVDYVVDTRRMSFATTGGEVEPPNTSWLTFDAEGGHDEGTAGGPVNEYAHRQIRERLGIPAKYYDRMRSDASGLLDRNVMHWLHNEPEKRMVRMLEGNVRAFLSNRYRRLDNIDLMNRAVLPELAKYGERLAFHVAALTDDRLYIRAILPDMAADVSLQPGDHTIRTDGGGDIVQAGVQIRNSEVGNGKLEVAPFVWRLVCLNGLVRADMSLGRYHVGREQEESAYAIYRDDTLAADDRAFWMKVRDAVGAALSDVTFTTIVNQMREAATGERIADPVAATERLAKAHDLTETEGTSILTYLVNGGDLSQWGTANAVTAAAKGADSFDRQEELERIGGALVALPSGEWSKIAR